MMTQATSVCRFLPLAGVLLAALVLVPAAPAQQQSPEPPPPDRDVRGPTAADDSTQAGLRLLAKATTEGVILRWAPTTARAWNFVNDAGYVVERFAPGAVAPDSATIDSLRTEVSREVDTDIDRAVVRRLLADINYADVDTAFVAHRLRAAGVDSADISALLAALQSEEEPSILDGFQRITPDTLRPWPRETWRARLDSNSAEDRYAAIAAQMLHGESVIASGKGPYARLEAKTSEYQNRYGFSVLAADLDATAARGLALRYTDETADPETRRYVYRVYPAAQPEDYAIDTAYVSVGPEDRAPAGPPSGLSAEVQETHTSLGWPKDEYAAYYVERASGLNDSLYAGDVSPEDLRPEDLVGGDFERLTELPYLSMNTETQRSDIVFFRDTTATTTRNYTYRVYGITPFATVSLPAQVRVRGRDLTPPPAPTITTKEQVEGSTVRLGWELPEAPPDLEGFEIGISNDPEGPFVPDTSRGLLSPSARTATDSRAISNTNNFYVVTAIDTAGNRTPSSSRYVHLVDSIPPPPPSGLEAQADTNGVVTVTWALGDTPDLMGYHIRQAHAHTDEAALETGEMLRDTMYVDTLEVESLTKETYYDVIALDQNSNRSAPSRIRVELPDIVPPTAPVIRDARPTTESVELAWTASVSDDVARHLVLRRTPAADSGAGDAWTELAALADTAEAYVDAAVEQGQHYTYLVVAEDSAGLRSEGGQPVQARPYDSGVRPGVEAVEATVQEEEAVQLTWDYPNPAAGAYWFVVYRSEGEGGLRRYHAGDGPTFEDAAARTDSTYRYAVQVVYEDGGQSRLSKKVEVVFPHE